MVSEDTLKELDRLMKRGIHTVAATGKPCFSGCSYDSLCGRDRYFGGIARLRTGGPPEMFMDASDGWAYQPGSLRRRFRHRDYILRGHAGEY